MMDQKMLYDLLKEVRDDQKKHGEILGKHSEELTKQSVCMDNIREDVNEMKTVVSKNTEDVAEHIYRTDLAERNLQALQDLHSDNQVKINQNEERIEKLEGPVKAKKWFKDNLKWMLTTFGLSISIITKIMGLW